MFTAVVFVDIEKALDILYVYKLSKLEFAASLIELIAFLTSSKFKILVEGEFSTPREIAAGVPQGSVFAPILYSLFINDVPVAPGTHLALFVDDTYIYATKRQCRVLCKLQSFLQTFIHLVLFCTGFDLLAACFLLVS
jgi:hypothetical protein